MSTLRYWWLQWSHAYHRLALRQIDPSHPDVPYIVSEINRLNNAMKG